MRKLVFENRAWEKAEHPRCVSETLRVGDMKEVIYKDLGDSLLVKALGYSPKLRIIDIFLTNPYFDFSREELARELRMNKQTFYKYFQSWKNTE